MDRKFTLTLALILAGGLAAGIALARPGDNDVAAGQAVGAAEAAVDGRAPASRATRGGVDDAYAGDQPADADAGAEPAAGAVQVAAFEIRDFAFSGPATVAPGAQLTVTNADTAPHTLTFRSGGVDTGTLDGGASTTIVAPTEPGTYEFFCAIHPSMVGSVTVG
jgi:plastocyanin